jgi:hypothetical protein
MTNQEAFDYVVAQLVAQGEPSVSHGSHGGVCQYRGNNGCRCAAGWLIPDDKYSPNMEGNSVDYPPIREVLPSGPDFTLLVDLQSAHDWAVRSRVAIDNDAWLHEFLLRARTDARSNGQTYY